MKTSLPSLKMIIANWMTWSIHLTQRWNLIIFKMNANQHIARDKVTFSSRTPPPLLHNHFLKQTYRVKQEGILDPRKIDNILVQSDLIKINQEI